MSEIPQTGERESPRQPSRLRNAIGALVLAGVVSAGAVATETYATWGPAVMPDVLPQDPVYDLQKSTVSANQ